MRIIDQIKLFLNANFFSQFPQIEKKTLKVQYEKITFTIRVLLISQGDIVPSDSRYALLAFAFVLVGLSVVSMSFSVLQAKGEALFNSLLKNIDQEYKDKQTNPDQSEMATADNDQATAAAKGLMQICK